MAVQNQRTARRSQALARVVFVAVVSTALTGCETSNAASQAAQPAPAPAGPTTPQGSFDELIQANAKRMLDEGKQIFRFDTFGSEDFWGGKLGLHRAIVGEKLGGVGPV